MSGQEIVSIHLGSYSNYVASHFWNLQDEILGYSERDDWAAQAGAVDHSILFNIKEHAHQGALSYQPRALFVDLSGSLGGVRFGARSLQAAAEAEVRTWGGAVQKLTAAPVPESSFVHQLHEQEGLDGSEGESELQAYQAALELAAMQLDTERAITSWTDFLKVQLPPSSVWMLPGIWQGVTDFNCYVDGSSALGGQGPAGAEAQEEVVDRVRHMCEECDNMQGFQVIADDLGGFGSITQSLLEALAADYGSREVLLFSVRQPSAGALKADAAVRWSGNEALCSALLPELCSLYVPLTVPWDQRGLQHLQYKLSNPFQTSAVLASAIDSITFPTRLHPGGTASGLLGSPLGAVNMHSLVKMLQGRGGPNLAAASMYLPCPPVPTDLHQAQALSDTRTHQPPASSASASSAPSQPQAGQGSAPLPALLGLGLPAMAALTRGIEDKAEECLAESMTLRGALSSSGEAASTSQAQAALDAELCRGAPRRCVRHRCVSALPLAVPLPFPRSLFRDQVGSRGQLPGAAAPGPPGPQAPAQGRDPARAAAEAKGGSELWVGTSPVMTKLMTTAGFSPLLEQVAQQWSALSRSSTGYSLLQSWGYEGAEGQEVKETLLAMAASYHQEEEDLLD